jgi:hypothetical protein
MLDTERQFYAENLADWLKLYPGKIVLVKGRELVGTFDTDQDALAEGSRRFGLEPYLVRRVKEQQEDVSIPALTLGILRADTTRPI